MASGDDNLNPGNRYTDDLFNKNPHKEDPDTSAENSDTPPQNDSNGADSSLNDAEQGAASQFKDQKNSQRGNVASQEKNIKPSFGSAKDLYKQSFENRKKGGGRGLLIGFGAGGGIISLIAGLAFLSPFKLQSIMDGIINRAGDRVERVVIQAGERVLIKYLFDKDKIATGNPIGDLFANLKTTKFEVKIKDQYGLSFERDPGGALRIVHDGTDLGNFKNASELQQYLNRGDLTTKEVRRVFRLVVTDQKKSIFKYWQRAKFVKFLRLKYKIPKLAVREQKNDEKIEDYNKFILEEQDNTYIKSVGENIAKLTGTDINNTEGLDTFDKDVGKSLKETSKKLVGNATERLASGLAKPAIAALATGGIALAYQVIDTSARIWAAIEDDPNFFVTAHAEAAKNASVQFGVGIATLSDQSKAFMLPFESAQMAASQFDGMEESQSFNLIDKDEAIGVGLDPLEKINETATPVALSGMSGALFSVGKVLFTNLSIWANTISKFTDFISASTIGKLTEYISATPAAKALYEKITPFFEDIYTSIMKFVGGAVDSTVQGAKRHLFATQGFTAAYDDKAKDMGMRLLTEQQARVADAEVRSERKEMLASMPLSERLFDMNNSDSLANKLVASVPTPTLSNPLSSVAAAGMRMVAQAPTNFASITTARAYAEDLATVPTLESLFDTKAYGALPTDFEAEIDARAFTTGASCPANDPTGASFNNCSVYTEVAQAWSCAEVGCADLDPPKNGGGGGGGNISVSNDVKELATQILAKPDRITFESEDENGTDGAKQDLERAKNGFQTHCEQTSVALDPALLRAILNVSLEYTFRINSMVSDHECDGLNHPKGKAVDMGMVNGVNADGSTLGGDTYRGFVVALSKQMKTGGGIGQSQCLGQLPLENNVKQFTDICHHIHMETP